MRVNAHQLRAVLAFIRSDIDVPARQNATFSVIKVRYLLCREAYSLLLAMVLLRATHDDGVDMCVCVTVVLVISTIRVCMMTGWLAASI